MKWFDQLSSNWWWLNLWIFVLFVIIIILFLTAFNPHTYVHDWHLYVYILGVVIEIKVQLCHIFMKTPGLTELM